MSATDGKWLGVVKAPGDLRDHGDDLGVFGVHGVLLHTGRVLLFSGRLEGAGYLYRSWTWDATTFSEGDTTLTGVEGRWFLSSFDQGGPDESPPGPEPTWDDDSNIDLFCAHHVTLEDGRALVVGGAGGVSAGDARGNQAIFTYHPIAERWSKEAHLLQRGRWYPTAVALPDGRVVVLSGRKQSSGAQEEVAEVLTPPDMTPSVIAGADRRFYIYPGALLVPGGRIFYVPTNWMIETQNEVTALGILNPTLALEMTGPSSGSWVDFPDPGDPTSRLAPSNPWREEGTFVLLPPAQAGRIMLIGGGYATNALSSTATQRPEADIDHCEILETQGASPRWVPAGDMHHGRVNVHAVLLPNGKVLILGGHDSVKRNAAHTDQTTAEIYDPTVPYDPADPHAAFTEVAAMTRSRNYHGSALLLPDGRVLVAGGEDTPHFSGNQTNVEIYAPPYCYQGARAAIDPIAPSSAPPGEIRYGGSFDIQCATEAQAQDVADVVLMRPGAATHHTDTQQRHVPLSFSYEGGNRVRATAVLDPTVAPPGHYMLFTVDALGKPCERAQWVRLSHRRCRLITDRSTFSVEEIQAIPSRSVEAAFFVHVEGFLPSELGIASPTPSPADIEAWAPDIVFRDGATEVTTLRARATDLLLEDPTLPPSSRQRFTFVYTLHVDDLAVFPAMGGAERRTLSLETNRDGFKCHGRIHLMRQPDPYVLDGATHWLSTDVRVFKIRAGESRFGVTLDAADPVGFLREVLSRFDGDATLMGHAFESIATDQAASRLQIAETEGGIPVFNFAIARVRYRAVTVAAANVRLHFRMFTTAATNLAYNPSTTYRTTSTAGTRIAVPGTVDSEVVTIPFYGRERVDLSTSAFADQTDDTNEKSMPADAGGAETRRYFGALLDFNLSSSRLPATLPATATGPFASGDLQSIADLVRGRHQCLVAEVDFTTDPIQLGDTPANSDNLAQRNLAIEGSDNPGGAEAHTVGLTFDLEPTWGLRETVKDAGLPPLNTTRAPQVAAAHHGAMHGAHADHDGATDHDGTAPEGTLADAPMHIAAPVLREQVWGLGDRLQSKDLLAADPVGARFAPAHHEHASAPTFGWFEPDELMIDWGEFPAGTTATLFMPGLSARHVERAVRLRAIPPQVAAIDDHTLRLDVGGVTYVPLPVPTKRRQAGLLTLALPQTVRFDQRFRVTVRQLAMAQRTVAGMFELAIEVRGGESLLVDEARWYAVLGHILQRIDDASRWKPVLERLHRLVAGRVRGFGGDPTRIKPTLDPADLVDPHDCRPEAPSPESVCEDDHVLRLCQRLLAKLCGGGR